MVGGANCNWARPGSCWGIFARLFRLLVHGARSGVNRVGRCEQSRERVSFSDHILIGNGGSEPIDGADDDRGNRKAVVQDIVDAQGHRMRRALGAVHRRRHPEYGQSRELRYDIEMRQ